MRNIKSMRGAGDNQHKVTFAESDEDDLLWNARFVRRVLLRDIDVRHR